MLFEKKSKKTIVLLYYTVGVYPLRDTIHKHLYAWKKYSKHRVIYVNVAYGFPHALLKRIKIDAIVFHTIFVGSMRWDPSLYEKFTDLCWELKYLECPKIAIPQDEFLNTELLNDFINEFGITHVLTCADKKDWKYIYNKVDFKKVKFKTVLTGYIDESTVNKVHTLAKNVFTRDIDIGYRAWKAEYWLGRHGLHKVTVAENVEKLKKKMNLKTDISLKSEDTLLGDSWFKFLLRCKATIGVEGGSSVLDRQGTIRLRVNAYMKIHPNASFASVKTKFFNRLEGKLGLLCISPRHLEACMTRTVQLLIEGEYNGILKPWVHYIPIKRDYSNLEEALLVLKDSKQLERISNNAYQDIVGSGKYTYKTFIEDIESSIPIQSNENTVKIINQSVSILLINLKDRYQWKKTQYARKIIPYINRISDRLSKNKATLQDRFVYQSYLLLNKFTHIGSY